MTEFKPGDVVQLKSGGPLMTVDFCNEDVDTIKRAKGQKDRHKSLGICDGPKDACPLSLIYRLSLKGRYAAKEPWANAQRLMRNANPRSGERGYR